MQDKRGGATMRRVQTRVFQPAEVQPGRMSALPMFHKWNCRCQRELRGCVGTVRLQTECSGYVLTYCSHKTAVWFKLAETVTEISVK